MNDHFVYIDQFGLLGSNFYWRKHEQYGISQEELLAIGITDGRVLVHEEIIEPLKVVDARLKVDGYGLYIKEGYRSKDLYELVYRKRVAQFGKEETDRLLNIVEMPHAEGKTVDVALWDPKADQEVYLRKAGESADAMFINFYRNKDDAESKKLQELQDYTINVMQDNGFRLGKRKEYFHFSFDPASPKNYLL